MNLETTDRPGAGNHFTNLVGLGVIIAVDALGVVTLLVLALTDPGWDVRVLAGLGLATMGATFGWSALRLIRLTAARSMPEGALPWPVWLGASLGLFLEAALASLV